MQNQALGTNRALSRSFNINDAVFLGAAFLSFLLSVYLWFTSSKEQGLFVGLWVPSIISLGIYFRLIGNRHL